MDTNGLWDWNFLIEITPLLNLNYFEICWDKNYMQKPTTLLTIHYPFAIKPLVTTILMT